MVDDKELLPGAQAADPASSAACSGPPQYSPSDVETYTFVFKGPNVLAEFCVGSLAGMPERCHVIVESGLE